MWVDMMDFDYQLLILMRYDANYAWDRIRDKSLSSDKNYKIPPRDTFMVTQKKTNPIKWKNWVLKI